MNTDERIHDYCRDVDTINNNNKDINLKVTYKLIEKPKSSQLSMNDYVKTQKQKQLIDELKSSSIDLSASCWNNIFDYFKMVIVIGPQYSILVSINLL
jgi:hypothetical protein